MRVQKNILAAAIILCLSLSLFPNIKVAATYPYIGDLVKKIGGEHVEVKALSKGSWDPHTIVPKPSLIAKVRKADLLVINGAQLELGWLPPLLNQANNSRVMPGQKGFLDLANVVQLIQVPTSVSRAGGDIHPAGNPHYCLGPDNIPKLASAVASKLGQLDPKNNSFYEENSKEFLEQWQKRLADWDARMLSLKGKKVIEYHRNVDYFLERFGIEVCATVEPLPGIPPTSKHIRHLIEKVKNGDISLILHDVYHSKKTSKYLSQKTGIRYVVLPHDVEAVKEATDIVALYEQIVSRLSQ